MTAVVPTGKRSPDAWFEIKLSTAQLSAAVGVTQVTTAPHDPASFVTEKSAGSPSITGISSSKTVIANVASVVFPWISVAV